MNRHWQSWSICRSTARYLYRTMHMMFWLPAAEAGLARMA
jgi:hypothetical protein